MASILYRPQCVKMIATSPRDNELMGNAWGWKDGVSSMIFDIPDHNNNNNNKSANGQYISLDVLYFSLTHWGRDNMAAISQTTLSNAFTQYSNIGSDNGLVPTRRQAIIWTNGG